MKISDAAERSGPVPASRDREGRRVFMQAVVRAEEHSEWLFDQDVLISLEGKPRVRISCGSCFLEVPPVGPRSRFHESRPMGVPSETRDVDPPYRGKM